MVSTMEKFKVAQELPKEKLAAICTTKRIFFILAVLGIGMLTVAGLATWNIVEFDNVLNSLMTKDKWNSAQDEIKKNINDSLRLFVSEQIGTGVDEMKKMKTTNTSLANPGHELRQSFKDIQDHMNSLIFTVGNLSTVVSKINSSSHWKISRLRRNFIETKNNLTRIRNKLTQLNDSVHTDMVHFVVSLMNNLKQELTILRNSTATNISELWKHWNRTDAEIEDIIKLMAQQNETLHFKIAYHSDVLYSKVKDIENKQSKFHSDTKRNIKELRRDLNQTRYNLQNNFDNQISRMNKTWHEVLVDIDRYFRLSMNKIDIKVTALHKQFQTNLTSIINKQNDIKREFAKTKAGFQEKDRKHDSAISGHTKKIKRMEQRIEDLEDNLDRKTREMKTLENKVENLQKSVTSMTNRANSVLGSYFPVILLLFSYYNCT